MTGTSSISNTSTTAQLGAAQCSSPTEALKARLADLYAKQESATGWGAAVGERHEEIKAIESQLRALEAPLSSAGSCDAQTIRRVAGAMRDEALDCDQDGYFTALAQVAVKALRSGDVAQPPANPAEKLIGQIEERFPNWKSYRDLIDCIDCTLHALRRPLT